MCLRTILWSQTNLFLKIYIYITTSESGPENTLGNIPCSWQFPKVHKVSVTMPATERSSNQHTEVLLNFSTILKSYLRNLECHDYNLRITQKRKLSKYGFKMKASWLRITLLWKKLVFFKNLWYNSEAK